MKIWLDLDNIFSIIKSLSVWLFKDLFVFSFNHHGTPTGNFPECFMKIQLDLAEIYRIKKMFICLFVCLFVYGFVCCFFVLSIVGNPEEVALKVSWWGSLIWLRYLGSKNVYFFVCLFIDLFFYFNHLGIPTGIYPQNFMKIRHDLAEIYRIWKCLFVCLFVYRFVCFLF